MQTIGTSIRRLSVSLIRPKQLPKHASENVGWSHPRIYKIRRNRPYQHRPDYQRNEQEVLFDQILQPHYPTAYRFPGKARKSINY